MFTRDMFPLSLRLKNKTRHQRVERKKTFVSALFLTCLVIMDVGKLTNVVVKLTVSHLVL
jgi:hypothetical protein